MTVLNKKQMSEEDVKLNYITPAILRGCRDHITMQTKVKITDGQINIKGNMAVRKKHRHLKSKQKADPSSLHIQ